ncbi:maleylpyruvate isomerase N-terminal domain-containing protein [Lentzea sp. BCCO 10_0798]|uniref:Maleylpyruvate isomerase N-terminal domain-containing protein n=1 Tax=Lentzea kristufekii TaxID=3095430 RepID=A0ABU4TUH7_9PSEU|nr:maleylpyruvate isomerase N-terminal domain-containing protein [Lentzea sp. BCCO 10_0798]MDX8051954.1 maleylpyruvate isomerase N-terminal domain-containing protein [Lentzea sp. BCCO 10_0798]
MFEEIYREARQRVVGLTMGLSAGELGRTVPACPEWTVHQVVAHLSGAASDLVSGRMEGAPSDEWTARHVAERENVPVEELLEEWNVAGDKIGEMPRIPFQLAMDTITHEADLRAALGRERLPDTVWQPTLVWMTPRRLTGVTVKTEFGDLGDGPITLEVEGYELWRAFFGRRSRRQMESWNWSGPAPIDAIPFFPPRESDLVE